MEQIDYNLLFRWFVGLSIDDAVWDASTFSKNRDRLLEADVAQEFLASLLIASKGQAASVERSLLGGWNVAQGLGLDEELPAEGRRDPPQARRLSSGRNGERNFHREKRSNETHASTTDPDAKLFRKGDGKEAGFATWVIY